MAAGVATRESRSALLFDVMGCVFIGHTPIPIPVQKLHAHPGGLQKACRLETNDPCFVVLDLVLDFPL